MKWIAALILVVIVLVLVGCADDMMLFSDRHDTRSLTLSKTDARSTSKTDARDLSTTVYNVLDPQNVDLTGDGVPDAQLTQEQVDALRVQGWEIKGI